MSTGRMSITSVPFGWHSIGHSIVPQHSSSPTHPPTHHPPCRPLGDACSICPASAALATVALLSCQLQAVLVNTWPRRWFGTRIHAVYTPLLPYMLRPQAALVNTRELVRPPVPGRGGEPALEEPGGGTLP